MRYAFLLLCFCSCTYALSKPVDLPKVGLRLRPPSGWVWEKFPSKDVFKPKDWAKEPRPTITVQAIPTEMELDSFMATDFRENIVKYEGFVPKSKEQFMPGDNYDWGFNSWTYIRPDGLKMFVYRRYYELPEYVTTITIEATEKDWARNQSLFEEFLNNIVVLLTKKK
ncbi:MAG: hypothetical protein DRP63_01980 [Planctomycetota bacterium]|nr:MAG: hypothetical protein DRP63_01980 [Planctomycetota bacterium]